MKAARTKKNTEDSIRGPPEFRAWRDEEDAPKVTEIVACEAKYKRTKRKCFGKL